MRGSRRLPPARSRHSAIEGKKELAVGGFGWVEGLRPDAAGVRESEGFIHAPSIAHAATAAVLRAGHHAHGSDDPGSLFAVDLRSERVRTAAWLLDGIRQGQALGDLLGCRFERRLHDAEIDHFIDDCRRRVLEGRGITRAPRGPVDGLALAELYGSSGVRIELPDQTSFVVRPRPVETEPQRRRLQMALDDILAAMDSVADASIADSVHHVLQGSTDRASATLDAVATGAIPPPELRGWIRSTGREHLPSAAADARGGRRRQARLGPIAARGAGAGARRLVPRPAGRSCQDPLRGPCRGRRQGRSGEPRGLVASQSMSALDAVLERLDVGGEGARGCWHRASLRPSRTALRSTSRPSWPKVRSALPTPRSWPRRCAALIGGARAMDAQDLAVPGTDVASGLNLADAAGRLATFRDGLAKAEARLAALLPEPSEEQPRPVGEADLAALRKALLAAAWLRHRHGADPRLRRGGPRSAAPGCLGSAGCGGAQLDAHAALAVTAPLEERAAAPLGGLPLLRRPGRSRCGRRAERTGPAAAGWCRRRAGVARRHGGAGYRCTGWTRS